MQTGQLKPVTTYPAIVGGVLTQMRNQTSLRQEDVAKAIGVTQTTWSRVETGQSSLTVEHLRMASYALGRTPDDVLNLAEQATANLQAQGIEIRSTRNEIDMTTAVAVIATVALVAMIAAAIAKSSK
jgi:transcriptional regulator with XRE-family HTH domain